RPLVVDAVGDPEQIDVGGRDPNALGLGPGEVTAEGASAEDRVILAERRLSARAEPTAPARDVERRDHAIARVHAPDAVADGFDDPRDLVPQDAAGVDRRLPVEEMQIRSADRA